MQTANTNPFPQNNTVPNETPYPFGTMKSCSGENIALKSVAITGDVDGLLFSSAIRQEYKNETDKTLEIIYTFPIGWGTALLGMNAEIGGKKLKGEIVEKQKAEAKYEEAIKDGDSPIMLQQSSTGLYTANLGNIKPGETVSVEIHCAKLLNFEQGRVRLCIPTVIGERYGNEYCPGGLAPHETSKVDENAKYPFTLNLTLHGDIARGDISCPSHTVRVEELAGGRNFSLHEDGFLDRDFILIMGGLSAASHAQCIQDEDCWMTLASFQPEMPEMKSSPLGVKILVDCSGSMSGSSIQEAQRGLGRILSLLTSEDLVSYSRFGSNVEHMSEMLSPCSVDTIARLSAMIDATDANMGGTSMDKALNATFALKQPAGQELPSVVLLITDGDVWDIKNILDSAKKSGQRIFAIGVGFAPAESLLRELAEQTGGACEFVTPNEDMSEAIVRMFHRMRGAIAKDIRIKWGQTPHWQSELPKYIYDGETVHAFALLPTKPEVGPVLVWEADEREYNAKCDAGEETTNTDLLRLGRMRQMEQTESEDEKLSLALKYELVSELTSAILVYERAARDKIVGLPTIQQVPQMPAYGHGMNMARACFINSGGVIPTIRLPWMKKNNQNTGLYASPEIISLKVAVHQSWRHRHLELTTLREFIDEIKNQTNLKEAFKILSEIAADTGLSEEQVWAAFIGWTMGESNIDRHSLRLLQTCPVPEKQMKTLKLRFISLTRFSVVGPIIIAS